MNTDQIKKALNSKLPMDIFIKECSIVSDDFHSRFSATKREYLYYINYDNCPFKRLYSWNCKWLFDKDKLEESSKLLLGKHDFSLFSKASSETKNKFCNIEYSEWAFENGQAIYNIHADRFLQHMVRLLVGTMIEVGRGRIPLDDFLNMIHCKKTKFHSVRAPGEGLFLSSIQYD
jgi:tRNA pseudouridine38-40 synthase